MTTVPTRDGGEMTVPVHLFDAQLAFLRENGYLVRTADWLVAEIGAGRPIPARSVVISFDDGLADFYHIAAPALEKHSYPSTAFVLAAALEGRADRVRQPWPGGYMSSDQARALSRSGHVTFGCHGATHVRLEEMLGESIRKEVGDAKASLERILESEIALFAYPYGVRDMWNDAARRAVEDAGFRGAFTSLFGVNDPTSDVFRLRRSRISWRDEPRTFERVLAGYYDWYAGLQKMRLAFADLMHSLDAQRSSR